MCVRVSVCTNCCTWRVCVRGACMYVTAGMPTCCSCYLEAPQDLERREGKIIMEFGEKNR